MQVNLTLSAVSLIFCTAFGFMAGPACAQGGNSSTTLNLDNWAIRYNGVLPTGKVTLTWSKTGSFKSVSVQVDHINVADGTVVNLQLQELWRSGGSILQNVTNYPVTIRRGKGSLSISTSNGDDVEFLLPADGKTNIYVVPTGTNAVPMMGAEFGHLKS